MNERVSVEVVAAPTVNHAMAHNGLGFCHRIVVTTAVELAEVEITAELTDDFGTRLSRPWRHLEPTIGTEAPYVLTHPSLRLDGRALAAIEEESGATLTVRVAAPDGPVVVHEQPLRVLAARQWVMDPAAPLLSLELLAAFVQPNHPSVLPVVAEAATLLEKKTGRASLQITDVDAERIDAIVEAVFTAVHDRAVSYAQPPASWGYGQKVRTCADVLDGRVGTCLDTTVALASVLEHLGITPVLWIATGHAFLGYWRQPDRGLPEAASLSVAVAANAVDLKLLGVIETTLVTRERRPPRDLFRRAAQAPLDGYFSGGTHHLVGVVDVGMARLLRVYPVPARHERADGVVEIVEYVPAAGRDAAVEPSDSDTAAAAGPARSQPPGPPVPARVQAWKNALLDLTLRNRMLNLDQPMTQVRLLVPYESLGVVADVLQDGRTIAVRAVDDLTGAVISEGARDAYALPADVQRAMLSAKSTLYSGHAQDAHERELSRLRYRARTGREETGANPLMLTLGRLDWRLGDRELSAPLLLMPVEIRGLVMPYRIAADPTGAVSVNLSLLQKLELEFGFRAPGLHELPLRADGDGVDVAAALRQFREALDAAGLAFRVESEARLIIGGFTGFLLWRDLDQHWEEFARRPLVAQLLAERVPTPEPLATDPDELDAVVAAAPIAADGSQARAVAIARSGGSFVLEGPPGTGKSQTITNILADQLTAGRTVLFMAEKGAALDVVRQRLGEVGLLPYTLDLHDQNARPIEVRARLKSALEQRSAADPEAFRVAGQDVDTAARVLRGYRRRLHAPNAWGLSLWSARDSQLARGDGPTLAVPPEALEAAGSARAVLAAALDPLSGLAPDTAEIWGWAGPTPVAAEILTGTLAATDEAVRVALDAVSTAGPQLAALLLGATTHDELAALIRLASSRSPDGDALAQLGSARWRTARDELLARTADLERRAAPIWADFDPAVLDVALDSVRQQVREAEQSFFLGRKGRIVRAAGPVLVALRPGRRLEPRVLPGRLDALAQLADGYRRLADSWAQLPGLRRDRSIAGATPAGRAALDAELAELDGHHRALVSLAPPVATALLAARRAEPAAPDAVIDAWQRAADLLRAMTELTDGSGADLRRFVDGRGLLPAWTATGERRRADPRRLGLRRWQTAVEAVAPLAEPWADARWQLLSGVVRPEDATAALDRGVAAASMTERWDAGGFDGFDPQAHDRAVRRFVAASAELRAQRRTAGPAAVLDQRPFRPGGLFGQVASLEREVSRSRGGMSVRALLTAYGPVIAEVTPCVLVSPDSLARFVPPGAIDFDLVVFDEASQITVPDAVGALGRARSAVVAGDSKQMPPTRFAALAADQPELDEADDFLVVPDEESILSEFGQAGFPRLWLSWHYRSQDESLISFSNSHYYADRLSSFPAVPGQQHDTGVSFTRVPGTFLRSRRRPDDAGPAGQLRTNPVEAAAVVAEVLRRWEQRERSIGVVTFNIQQRGLIERMLWDSEVPGIREALVLKSDSLFVKNLENVQGDERDVVIFSTGFSVGDDGVLPLNFGPLNRFGGERRLNVAVTRARRRVMVFSSFEPEDIRLADTSSVGLRHLREYLELAKYGVPPRTARTVAAGRHADEIATALRDAGCTVETAVGLSDFTVDLAVAAPGQNQPRLAVLLDGSVWAGRSTTADRDALPYTVLGDVMGWPAVRRVWLPDWLTDRDRVVADLIEAAYAATETVHQVGETRVASSWEVYAPPADDAATDPESDTAAPDLDSESDSEPAHDPEVEPSLLDEPEPAADAADPSGAVTAPAGKAVDDHGFVESELPLRPVSRLDRAEWDTEAAAELSALIVAVVDDSGPVSVERLARRVVRAHGLSRLTDGRLAVVRRLIPETVLRDPEQGFCWPLTRDPLRWTGYRRSTDLKDRPLADVALREIVNAMADIAAAAMGITTEELVKQTYLVFGGNRLTQPAVARLREALELGERLGRLVVRGGVVTSA